MRLFKFIKELFKKSSKVNPYSKIDKLDKDGDCLFIQSSEGLTEDEILQVISEKLLNRGDL